MGKGSTLAGLVAGIAAGTVLGILFAPEKGSDTRKKISKKSKDSLKDLKNKYNETIDALTAKLDKAKDSGLNTYEEGKDLIKSTKQ